MLGVLGLSVTVVVLGVLLLNLNLRTTWPWPVKAGAILVTSAVFVLCYFALRDMLGWPASEPLPKQFVLIAAEVREPRKYGEGDGGIFIWARPTGVPEEPPRAFRLPYSKTLHKRVTQATGELRKGRGQTGRTERAQNAGAQSQSQGDSVQFYSTQRPSLPPKR